MAKKLFKDWGDQFQTPQYVCEYMARFIHEIVEPEILEPTAGRGNLKRALEPYGKVFSPDDFDTMPNKRFDWIVMNPPFSPMKRGYDILYRCMEMSDNIVALMPYHTLINGEKRRNKIMSEYGLVSVTHLPRKVFKGAKVQTCILHMRKGFKGDTIYKSLPENLIK